MALILSAVAVIVLSTYALKHNHMLCAKVSVGIHTVSLAVFGLLFLSQFGIMVYRKRANLTNKKIIVAVVLSILALSLVITSYYSMRHKSFFELAQQSRMNAITLLCIAPLAIAGPLMLKYICKKYPQIKRVFT